MYAMSSHKCGSLVLHCMDFRLGRAIHKYMEDNGLLGDSDLVSMAGAAKNLSSPDESSDRDLVLRQIEISERLHGASRVILINHTDCGAYGGHQAFTSSEEEIGKHKDELRNSKAIIEERFPDIKVQMVLLVMEENGGMNFEKVI